MLEKTRKSKFLWTQKISKFFWVFLSFEYYFKLSLDRKLEKKFSFMILSRVIHWIGLKWWGFTCFNWKCSRFRSQFVQILKEVIIPIVRFPSISSTRLYELLHKKTMLIYATHKKSGENYVSHWFPFESICSKKYVKIRNIKSCLNPFLLR